MVIDSPGVARHDIGLKSEPDPISTVQVYQSTV